MSSRYCIALIFLPDTTWLCSQIAPMLSNSVKIFSRPPLVADSDIASMFNRPDLIKHGKCDLIEEIIIGEDKVGVIIHLLILSSSEVTTHKILWCLCGRSLYCCVKEILILLGGVWSEMLMSCAAEEDARKVKGKKSIAQLRHLFSHALRQIPTIFADNAGYDSRDLVIRLKEAHYKGQSDSRLDTNQGAIGCHGKLLAEAADCA
ncbi:hypothetical protein DEU56DRAFT_780977 [Suillus clintonianus]|uniref:uncharacterized protein n=1 Tax=Suillus clintonianus TaxID=1904413 RepID=UPI001B86A87C|nr:uncharacterized protein DEU56DRAFT_780977 [Suillus clintonianus]KAG2150609.1 hypothetical protein DEU56DRAFT_780977 [Suillus clintonianus]